MQLHMPGCCSHSVCPGSPCRCRLLALVNLVAAPFLLVFLVIYFFMKASWQPL